MIQEAGAYTATPCTSVELWISDSNREGNKGIAGEIGSKVKKACTATVIVTPMKSFEPTPEGYKRVVSISLGSSKRNAREETTLLGQRFLIERIGTDGDAQKAAQLFRELDGKVDAFGLGGADLYVIAGDKKYTFSSVKKLVAGVKKTPILDGSGLKNTLEREAIGRLEERIGWAGRRVLMVSAVDRFGMAEAFAKHGADVLYGDLVFGLGINYPLRTLQALQTTAHMVLPVLTLLPQQWFYPTGNKQDESIEGMGTRYYSWAEVIAGDTHYVKRYAPKDLSGKIILTQTITATDRDWMKARGATLLTTTPRIGERNFATNVLEAMLVAHSGQKEALSEAAYLQYINDLNLAPEEL